MKDWIYDEFKHVGVDYSQKDNIDLYDKQMESFRDYEVETREILNKLNILNPNNLTLIDIGCGTGAFSIHASKYFKEIYAVDVSQEMLNTASRKARTLHIDNIAFFNSGFLQFRPVEKVDIIYTKWAFHHLPDYWKQAALFNMNEMLKPGGILFLSDFVFTCDPDYEANTDAFLKKLSEDFSKEFVNETKTHIKDEYSTFDWILQGMIERAGFKIERTYTEDILSSEYFCRKNKSFGSSLKNV